HGELLPRLAEAAGRQRAASVGEGDLRLDGRLRARRRALGGPGPEGEGAQSRREQGPVLPALVERPRQRRVARDRLPPAPAFLGTARDEKELAGRELDGGSLRRRCQKILALFCVAPRD